MRAVAETGYRALALDMRGFGASYAPSDDGLCRLFHPTPPTVEELRREAPGMVDVVRLENVGHWIQHEASDRLNAELLKFLDAIGLPRESDVSGHSG